MADVTRCLQAGANIEARGGKSEWTTLHMAAEHSDYPAVMKALLDAGANIEARTENGWTPLLR